jgi:hypothetical protein
MAKTETLSVRVSDKTRRALTQAAAARDVAGASALARDILEHWAEAAELRATKRSLRDAVTFLNTHNGWDDEPSDFFPQAAD